MKEDFWPMVRTAQALCEALNHLRQGIDLATDGLFEILPDEADLWDGEPLDDLRGLLLDKEDDLFQGANKTLAPHGLEIRFNRLHGEYCVHE